PRRASPESPPEDEEPPTMYEQLAVAVFEQMRGRADCLLDLHNASRQSIPFVIRDRLLYHDEAELRELEALQPRVGSFAAAIGLTSLNEFGGKRYVRNNLHRSVAGVALHHLRIPALTLELGGGHVLDPVMVEVGLVAVRNGLRWAGMLDGELEPVTTVPVIQA